MRSTPKSQSTLKSQSILKILKSQSILKSMVSVRNQFFSGQQGWSAFLSASQQTERLSDTNNDNITEPEPSPSQPISSRGIDWLSENASQQTDNGEYGLCKVCVLDENLSHIIWLYLSFSNWRLYSSYKQNNDHVFLLLLIDLYQRNGKSRHFLDEDKMRRLKDFVIDKEKRATFDLYQETYCWFKDQFQQF